jgi:hypothetical protein
MESCSTKGAEMKKIKFEDIQENEWLWPVHKGYRLRCCDCHLVHKIDFKVEDGDVAIKFRRDTVNTKKERAKMTIKQERSWSDN